MMKPAKAKTAGSIAVRNVSGDARYVPDADVVVDVDAVVVVGDALAASLLEQPANWAAVTKEEE